MTDPKLALGQRVFFGACNQCHPGGSAGYGPSLNDKPIPAWYIRLQVRQGLGAMPAFTSQEIPDDQLDAAAAYVQALHDLGGR